MKTPNEDVQRATAALEASKERLKKAEGDLITAFEMALVDLCNRYNCRLEASGTEGARIRIYIGDGITLWSLKDLEREL